MIIYQGVLMGVLNDFQGVLQHPLAQHMLTSDYTLRGMAYFLETTCKSLFPTRPKKVMLKRNQHKRI